jgi:hypothetical protein
MNYSREFIENVIKTLNEDVFVNHFKYGDMFTVSTIFNAGYCYYYAQMLKEIFPEAEIYNSQGHVEVKIGELFFDVDGYREENHKFSIQEQMSRIRQRQSDSYRGYFRMEDDDLHPLYYKSERNSVERLRRFACEESMIPDMLYAIEFVRNKYKIPQHESEIDSLFVQKEQVEGIIARLRMVFFNRDSKSFALLLLAIMPKTTIWSNGENFIARIGINCYNSNGFLGKAHHNNIGDEETMSCGEGLGKFQFEEELTFKGNITHMLSAEELQFLLECKSNIGLVQSK